MLPVLNIGSLVIQTRGLALLIGVWVALDVFSKTAGRYGQNAEHTYNAGFYTLLAGLFTARLGHVALYTQAYIDSPLSLISILPGSMIAWVGWIGGPLVGAWYLRRNKALNWAVLDALAPAMIILLATIAVANFLSGNGYGIETTLPWGIDLWSVRRHPTQIYEFAAALAVLGMLWRWRDSWPWAGAGFVVATLGYSTSRLILEALRADSWLLPGNFRGVQVLSWLAVLAALGVLAARAPRRKKAGPA